MTRIYIGSASRGEWIGKCCMNRDIPRATSTSDSVHISFDRTIKKSSLEAFHVVLLSCLIEELKKKGYIITLDCDQDLVQFLFSDINIRKYWGNTPTCHVDSPDIHRLNLWRITDEGKENYSISVTNYFKHLFPDKDVSFITTSLNELYYNIFDHANAEGNAFSYIYYDKIKERIYIAVCDFGLGVARTLRKKYPEYSDDSIALSKAIEKGISAKTRDHNRGFGLDDICSALSESDTFRMLSNKGFLYINKNNVKTINMSDLDFNGTLIYFDISTGSFEKEEVLESFSLD